MAIDTHVPPPPTPAMVKRLRDVLDRDFSELPADGRAKLASTLALDFALVPPGNLTPFLAGRLADPEMMARHGLKPLLQDDPRRPGPPAASNPAVIAIEGQRRAQRNRPPNL